MQIYIRCILCESKLTKLILIRVMKMNAVLFDVIPEVDLSQKLYVSICDPCVEYIIVDGIIYHNSNYKAE